MSFERVSRLPRPRTRNRKPRGSAASNALASLPRSCGGPVDEKVDVAQIAPCLRRQPFDEPIELLEAKHVAVQLIEEHGVQENARDLRRGRVAGDGRLVGFRARSRVARRHGEDAAGAQAHGRRERCGQADAAVSVPRTVHFDGRKEERQRGGGHHVVHAQVSGDALAAGAVPREHAAPLPALDPGHRLAGRVARSRQRHGGQPAGLQVARDAGERAGPVGRRVSQGAREAGSCPPGCVPGACQAPRPRRDADPSA